MSDSREDGVRTAILVTCLIVMVVATVSAYAIGRSDMNAANHNRAIEAGVGRWSVDEKTGDTTFVYGPAP
jgi:hypothetical protein